MLTESPVIMQTYTLLSVMHNFIPTFFSPVHILKPIWFLVSQKTRSWLPVRTDSSGRAVIHGLENAEDFPRTKSAEDFTRAKLFLDYCRKPFWDEYKLAIKAPACPIALALQQIVAEQLLSIHQSPIYPQFIPSFQVLPITNKT